MKIITKKKFEAYFKEYRSKKLKTDRSWKDTKSPYAAWDWSSQKLVQAVPWEKELNDIPWRECRKPL